MPKQFYADVTTLNPPLAIGAKTYSAAVKLRDVFSNQSTPGGLSIVSGVIQSVTSEGANIKKIVCRGD